MGGRGAYAQRRKAGRINAKLAGTAGGGGGMSEANMVSSIGATGSTNFPQIKNFDAKTHIVDFKYNNASKTGTIKIKDDTGRIFTGKHEGAGVSRVTYAFKEGFVMKFDGLKNADRKDGFGPGKQTKKEVDYYKNINSALVRPAGKSSTGVSFKEKSRVPDLVASHVNKTMTIQGKTYTKVTVALFSKAKGGHDTKIKSNSRKGVQFEKRFRQWKAGLRKRGVNVSDFGIGTYGRTITLHNVYFYKGKLKIVDLGV